MRILLFLHLIGASIWLGGHLILALKIHCPCRPCGRVTRRPFAPSRNATRHSACLNLAAAGDHRPVAGQSVAAAQCLAE